MSKFMVGLAIVVIQIGCSSDADDMPIVEKQVDKVEAMSSQQDRGRIVFPHLGLLKPHSMFDDQYLSGEILIPFFNPAVATFKVKGISPEDDLADFHMAVNAFLMLDEQDRKKAEPYIYQYYKDHAREASQVAAPAEIWKLMTSPRTIVVRKRVGGDELVYVYVECECEWESEHGLQIVFRNGNELCLVGPFTGHLTNGEVYDDPALENVIYVSPLSH